ncbi:MAG: dTDP-4-dehydrorhamnose 3,5-epimerase family protein [Bacteroidetes bacterium]|nr:dTDP-4-dehydrorhamnose 3,5-epimerase family protein [Bacteroidota bacterium]
MLIHPLPLSNARLLELPTFPDERGLFVKTFQETTLTEAGIHFTLKESYFSLSRKNVIRGMHFQLPPHQHAKIVFCPKGAILDVIVDLRKDSATFGQFHAEELSEANHRAYYIPEGFGHGFKALSDDAMTYYLVSSEYHRESDTGIRCDSFGFDWDCAEAIISVRDRSFPALKDFQSPF